MIIVIISTLYFLIRKMIFMESIILNNKKEVIYLKKKIDGFDNLIKHLYLRKIIKVILANLIKKYYTDLIIYKENGFINFKFKGTKNLSSKNAEILNKFKENYYKNYYNKFNNYIHLNFQNSQNEAPNYFQFNANDSSNELLEKSLVFLMKENIISSGEKEIIFKELFDTGFNIYKEDQEIQKLLKKI